MSNNNKLLSKRQLRRKVASSVQTLLSNNVANNADYIDIHLKNNHSNPKYKNYAAVDNIDGNITFSNSSSLKTNVVCDTFPKTDLPLLRHINGATNWTGRGSHKRPFKDPQMARVIKGSTIFQN